MARVICDVRTPDGERFDGDPRAALQLAIEEAHALGFSYHVAPELGFPVTLRRSNTSASPTRSRQLFRPFYGFRGYCTQSDGFGTTTDGHQDRCQPP